MEHVEACLNIITIVFDYVIETRLSIWSSSSAPFPFKTLLSMLTEGLKYHFWFSATEVHTPRDSCSTRYWFLFNLSSIHIIIQVLKRSQPLEDSARRLLDYYALHDDTPDQFVSEDHSEQAYREWLQNFNASHLTTIAVSAYPEDISSSARASADSPMVRKLAGMREREREM